MKNIVLNVLLAVVAACAVLTTTVVIRGELSSGSRPLDTGLVGSENVPDWGKYAAVGQRLGADSGSVTIVEFADYRCKYCRTFHSDVERMQERYPSEITLVYRHYPLQPLAREAATAAECAALQDRFEVYHSLLYSHQDSIGILSWEAFARKADMPDLGRFASCMADGEVLNRIEEDTEAAIALGVRGTPTLIINGLRVSGAPPQQLLDSLVAAILTSPR